MGSPKVIAVVNGKGGVGKTTSSINLAAAFSSEDSRVLLLDADPQGSATWWSKRSEIGIGFDVQTVQDTAQLDRVPKIGDYGVVVVDTPPALASDALSAAIAIADYLVLPTPPAPLDLAALIETVRSAVIPADVSYRVLLTRVDPRSLRETMEAQNTLLDLGIPAFHAFVRAYKAHERAALEGMSILQWKGKQAREAQADYRRVAEELQRDWRD
ncbi:MAG: ParA family protein [Cyanobacteria bacterium P01_A01_bin.3]